MFKVVTICLIFIAFAAVIAYIGYIQDKKRLCSKTLVVYSCEAFSIVMLHRSNSYELYKVERPFEVNSVVHIVDLNKIENTPEEENIFIRLNRRRIASMYTKLYKLKQGAFKKSDGSDKAQILRIIYPGTYLAVNIQNDMPVIIKNNPSEAALKSGSIINYDELMFAPSIKVAELV